MDREVVYNGEKFTVSKPENCKMKVSGRGLTATISIHTATNKYREDLDGWGTDCDTLKRALDSACQRILDKAGSPSAKELCAGMDEFYGSLDK